MVALPLAPTEVAQTIGPRLEAATVAHRDAQEVAAKRAREWRRLIVEALDAGMLQRDVAALAGVSRARLHKIIVGEYSRP